MRRSSVGSIDSRSGSSGDSDGGDSEVRWKRLVSWGEKEYWEGEEEGDGVGLVTRIIEGE